VLFQDGIGHAGQDSNHERISVPKVSQFSQQRLTFIGHYESAWRTENTGSNPVGAVFAGAGWPRHESRRV